VDTNDRVVLTSLLRVGGDAGHDDLRELFGLEIFDGHEGLPGSDRTRLACDRLRFLLASIGPVGETIADPCRISALHEWAALVDGALAAVMDGHCDVLRSIAAGGADTDYARRLRAELHVGDAVGVVLAAELGCGSDPAGFGTFAEYDSATAEFVLRTPCANEQKLLPEMVAPDVAVSAIVLARLVVDGQEHGVFPFLMHLTSAGRPADGVWITPTPMRPGWSLAGALVSFHEARLPFGALLATTDTHLSRDGRLDSTLRGRGERLRQAVERTHASLLCRSAGSLAMAKAALSVMAGLVDPQVMVPWLADTVAAAFLHRAAQQTFRQAQEAGDRLPPQELRRMAVAEALATRVAEQVLAASLHGCDAREMLVADRIAQYFAANQAAATAAGSNLMMRDEIARQVTDGLDDEPPAEVDLPADLTADPTRLLDLSYLSYLFRERERRRRGEAQDGLALAVRHGERLALETFVTVVKGVEGAGATGAAETLRRLAAIYALRAMQADAAWFVAAELLRPPQVRALQPMLSGLVAALAPEFADLVAAFDIPPEVLRAPVAVMGSRPEPALIR
jgi:acyl-CoA oxidase